jgi:hypothetical protein
MPMEISMHKATTRTLRAGRLVTSLVLIASLVAIAPEASQAASDKPSLLGFVTQDWRNDLPEFKSEAGKSPALFQLFFGLNESPWTWVAGMLDDLEDLGPTAYVEVTTNDLNALNRGDQDANLNAMANAVGEWLKAGANRHILIAPLPEMNLDWPWGGDPTGFKAGYQRIRDAFLDQGLDGTQIRFVFAPFGQSDSSGKANYADYYPGDSVVDLIGFAKYNKNNPWQDYQDTFQQHIDQLRNRISLAKPILITQTGSVVGDGGDRDVWFDDMFTKLKAHDQVIGAIYFNRNKGGEDYRVLTNGVLNAAFNQGYKTWSNPDQVSWIFDGRMDAWVQNREEAFASGFTDIQGHTFEADINWLATEGITKGCNPPTNNRFCPNDYVTRGAMAAFLVRALGYTDNGGGNLFIDDNNSIFETDIDKLGTAGVTKGCNPPTNNRFCPNDYVTRGAMAAFLHRALGG